MATPGTTRRQGSAAARSGARERQVGADYRATDEPLEYLHFLQDTPDLPDDGEEYQPTVLLNRRFHIVGVFVVWKEGAPDTTEFNANITFDGIDLANTTFSEADFDQSALKPIEIPTDPAEDPVLYDENKKISIRFNSSLDVELLEIILILRPVR